MIFVDSLKNLVKRDIRSRLMSICSKPQCDKFKSHKLTVRAYEATRQSSRQKCQGASFDADTRSKAISSPINGLISDASLDVISAAVRLHAMI